MSVRLLENNPTIPPADRPPAEARPPAERHAEGVRRRKTRERHAEGVRERKGEAWALVSDMQEGKP